MPEVIFTGPAGRIEGRYHPARQKNAPIAIVLHPHPQFGGTMNHQIIYQLYYAFVHRGFAAIRFNFRGVGRSQGAFDHGTGELSDAASALDWAQSINPEARSCWIAGFSFGAWIGMQLLMRRPEIEGFISIAPPANLYDFSFLAPCPSSGLIVHGDKDAVVPHKDVTGLVDKLKTQKGIIIEQKVIPGANHFFDGKVEPLMQSVSAYLDKRLKGDRRDSRLRPTAGDHAPCSGRGAPVVVGNVIGRPRRQRTARNANACASSASADQPAASAVSTVAGAKLFRQHLHQRAIARAAAGDDPGARPLRQMRHDPRHRLDRQRGQGRRAVRDRKFRQADIGEGEGIAVERLRRLAGRRTDAPARAR